MKGKFDAYLLWPLAKSVQNLIVALFTVRNYLDGASTQKQIEGFNRFLTFSSFALEMILTLCAKRDLLKIINL